MNATPVRPWHLSLLCLAFVADIAAAKAEDAIADEAEEKEVSSAERKWFSFHAFADVETAYICRGYIWDTRPY